MRRDAAFSALDLTIILQTNHIHGSMDLDDAMLTAQVTGALRFSPTAKTLSGPMLKNVQQNLIDT